MIGWDGKARNAARRIAKYDVAFPCGCRHRPPAALDSAFEQFFGRWLMIEDGDRHHEAQSACLEHGIHGIQNAHNHVVIVFVLHDDINKLGAGLVTGSIESRRQSREHRCNSSRIFSDSTGVPPRGMGRHGNPRPPTPAGPFISWIRGADVKVTPAAEWD